MGAGVVDSDYRGEVGVVLFNHSPEELKVTEGDAVAQLLLQQLGGSLVARCRAEEDQHGEVPGGGAACRHKRGARKEVEELYVDAYGEFLFLYNFCII